MLRKAGFRGSLKMDQKHNMAKKKCKQNIYLLFFGKKKNNFKSEPLINAVGIWMVRKDIHILPIRRDSLHNIKLSVSN